MKVSIKCYKHYKEGLDEVKGIRQLLNSVFKIKEIRRLVLLKEEYKNIFTRKLTTDIQINKLLKALTLSTAYLERLTAIKTDLLVLTNRASKLVNRFDRYIKSQDKFKLLSKKDQETVLEVELGVVNELFEDIDYKVTIVDVNVGYIDKLQFAIKTCLSTLKCLTGKDNYNAR